MSKSKEQNEQLVTYQSGIGRYFLYDRENGIIQYDRFSEVESILKNLQSVYKKTITSDGRPIWIDYNTKIGEIIIAYQSQTNRKLRRKLERESNKFFKKAETNRMKNQKASKIIDNLRYLIARAARISSVNFFPAGFYGTDGIINFLDRGNVSEEQSETLKSDGGKEFTKDQIQKAIFDLKENLGDDIPQIVREWEAKVKRFETSKKYTLFSVIGQDGIDSILDEVVNIKVMISNETQAVNEMVNFNGKNNPWVFLHFMFQYLDIRNGFNNDSVFGMLSERGKYMNLKSYIGYKEGQMEYPEILAAHPTMTSLVSKKLLDSKLDLTSYDASDVAAILEKLKAAYIGFGSLSNTDQQKPKNWYNEFIDKNKDLSNEDIDIQKCADVLDRIYGDDWTSDILEKLKDLQTAIEFVKNDPNQSDSKLAEANGFVLTRFKDVFKSDMFDTINAIAISIHDPKFTLELSSYSNIEKFYQFLTEEVVGGINVSVNHQEYSITNDDIKKLLSTNNVGSWDAKLKLVYPFIQRAIIKTKEHIGTDSNSELKQKELEFFKSVSGGTKDCFWYESDINGQLHQIGMVGGKLTLKSSWQHLDDDLNRWELGCIEEISMNSAGRRSIKPNKLISYKRKLENTQQFCDEGRITKKEWRTTSANLQNIIDGIEELNLVTV
jgi:hypothetical protein